MARCLASLTYYGAHPDDLDDDREARLPALIALYEKDPRNMPAVITAG